MELGCFLAGALLSSQGHMVTSEVLGCIEPIRDFLAIIFFASIGQEVSPMYLVSLGSLWLQCCLGAVFSELKTCSNVTGWGKVSLP